MKHKIIVLIILLLLVLLTSFEVFSIERKDVEKSIENLIVEAVLNKHPDYKSESVKVSFKYADSTFNFLTNREGEIKFSISDEYTGLDPVGDVIVPIKVIVDGVPNEKVYIRANVTVWKDIVVALNKMSKKHVVSEGDIVLERRDISSMPERYFVDVDAVLGKEMLSYLSKGTIVQNWMVRTPPDVSKNDEVGIFAQNNNLEISAIGIALEDGYVGDKIKVRNKDSKKELRATVVSTGEVEIFL